MALGAPEGGVKVTVATLLNGIATAAFPVKTISWAPNFMAVAGATLNGGALLVGGGSMLMLMVKPDEAVAPALSLTWTAKANAPDRVGVPERTPVDEARLSPLGSGPPSRTVQE